MSNCHIRCPNVISGRISPMALVCAVHRGLEIVNISHIHEIGRFVIISSFSLPIRWLVTQVFIWLDWASQVLKNGVWTSRKNTGHQRNARAHYSRYVILRLFDSYFANFVKKNSDLSQIHNIFRITIKNWVELCMFRNFSLPYFFIEKFIPGLSYGLVQKCLSSNSDFDGGNQVSRLKNDSRSRNCSWLNNKNTVLTKCISGLISKGGPGMNFSMKK